MSEQTPSANVPEQGQAEPLGDRGQGDKTWAPEPGEQGISNRVGDEDPSPDVDSTSFGHDNKDVVSMAEEDPTDDDEFDDEEDDEEDEDDGEGEGEGDEEDAAGGGSPS